MSHKVVSIITPSFNRGYIVGETASSIFSQSYPHWEWMIVDDGSNDDSLEVLKAFAEKDKRVKVLSRDREPKGACACRNIAVEKSTGDYLIFLDTDDLMAPFCLEQRTRVMEENPDCDFAIFSMLLFKKSPYDLKLLWNVETGEDDLERILKNDPVCQGTGTLWKKKSFQQIGMWREDLKLWQDIELHIRSLLWPMKFIKRLELEPDVFLRVSDDSLSRMGYNSLPKMKSRMSVFAYACEEIRRKGILEKHWDGLRDMGNALALSAIQSRRFSELEELLRLFRGVGLFKKEELAAIRRYAFVFKTRLARIGAVERRYLGPLQKMTPRAETPLCRKPYLGRLAGR